MGIPNPTIWLYVILYSLDLHCSNKYSEVQPWISRDSLNVSALSWSWIGRVGPQHWPQWLPDPNSLDSYVWRQMNDLVYEHKVDTYEYIPPLNVISCYNKRVCCTRNNLTLPTCSSVENRTHLHMTLFIPNKNNPKSQFQSWNILYIGAFD
jgi:hypothetical protein